jgi:VCBS repeat-containing protein
VSFTTTGVNDAAVIGDPANASVTEDLNPVAGSLSATGTLSITDADQGQSSFQTTVTGAIGNLGSLTLATNGDYTYSIANADVQYLGAGQTRTENFTVTSFDGTTKQVSFTTTGANDAAVIGNPNNAAVTEDLNPVAGTLSATGTISISDADQGQSSFQTTVAGAAGNLGNLTLATNGDYTYSIANADVQYLGAGQTRTENFTVTSFDGTTKQVSFTTTGVNDAAVIGDPANASVTEDVAVSGGNLSAAGTLSITDADQGQSSFQTTVTGQAGNLGSLTLATNGDYTYSIANADVQYLGAGQTRTENFTVTSFDGTSKQVSFTTTGANDAAVIGDPANASVTEDLNVSLGNLSAAGTLSIADADQGQASFQTTVGGQAGNLGNLVLAANGGYTYTVANAAVQSLGGTDTHVDTFTVTAFDGTTKQVSFTINGANDVAAITGTSTGSVQEDTGVVGGLLTTGGTLAASDADAGQSAFQAQAAAAGTYGTFTLTAGGAWTYAVSNSLAAVQALNTGQSLSDSFTATSQDGSASQLVTVTIQGLNDVTALTGTTADNTFSFSATGTDVSTITDPGGNDLIAITGDNAVLSTLNFEKVGSDLQIQVNNQSITVLNHYGAGNAMEQISFAPGQSFAGYALAGTYNVFAGSGFVAGNGSSDDVVAGTSGSETVNGGGGNSGRDLLFGNASDDTLIGQREGDLLVGSGGNDSLQGGDGNDVLVGGAGNDTFVFNTALAATNVDHVFDFQANATDTFLLSKATFSGLATAGSAGGTTLQATEFLSAANAGTASVGAGVHVLFDSSTGNLYYDADGGSSAGRTLFATVDLPGLTGTVDATDFKVGL